MTFNLFYFLNIVGMHLGNVNSMENIQTTATIAKELLESGSSPTAKAMSLNTETHSVSSQQVI